MELLTEPFHIHAQDPLGLGGMEKNGKTFNQEVNDVVHQYT